MWGTCDQKQMSVIFIFHPHMVPVPERWFPTRNQFPNKQATKKPNVAAGNLRLLSFFVADVYNAVYLWVHENRGKCLLFDLPHEGKGKGG